MNSQSFKWNIEEIFNGYLVTIETECSHFKCQYRSENEAFKAKLKFEKEYYLNKLKQLKQYD